jgi:DNA-binding TFAR19-related protein (PDSD5 family)
MSDADLNAIRQKRLAELQASQKAQGYPQFGVKIQNTKNDNV